MVSGKLIDGGYIDLPRLLFVILLVVLLLIVLLLIVLRRMLFEPLYILLSHFIFVSNAHSQLASQSNKQVTFENVIEAYAKSSGEKIFVDPRVK